MSLRVIGMIGVTPPQQSSMHVIRGEVSPQFVRDFARAHENAGFDHVLVGYTSSSADGMQVAAHAAAHTERLAYLVAHRPGVVLPMLAARTIATLDRFCEGRLAIHVIAGLNDKEQQAECDFIPHADRYRRAAEYLHIIRKAWSEDQPFDYAGEFYRVNGAFSSVKPFQKPHPLLFFGGSGALDMGAAHCDVLAMYGEPLKETAATISDFRERVRALGRPAPRFNISFRPIIGDTEGQAWDKAHRILADIETQSAGMPNQPANGLARRLTEVASRGDIHDERLWMAIARVTGGGGGNSSCLVGTAEQVAQAMLQYYRLGVDSFLIRGFDPVADVEDYGRELIPRLKAGARELEKAQ